MVYPPPSNTTSLDDLTRGILSYYNGKEITLLNDFNLSTLKWDGDISRFSPRDLIIFFTVLPFRLDSMD